MNSTLGSSCWLPESKSRPCFFAQFRPLDIKFISPPPLLVLSLFTGVSPIHALRPCSELAPCSGFFLLVSHTWNRQANNSLCKSQGESMECHSCQLRAQCFMGIGQHAAGLSEDDPTVVTWCGLMRESRATKHKWNGAHNGPGQTFPLFVTTSIIFSKRKSSFHRVRVLLAAAVVCSPLSTAATCFACAEIIRLIYCIPVQILISPQAPKWLGLTFLPCAPGSFLFLPTVTFLHFPTMCRIPTFPESGAVICQNHGRGRRLRRIILSTFWLNYKTKIQFSIRKQRKEINVYIMRNGCSIHYFAYMLFPSRNNTIITFGNTNIWNYENLFTLIGKDHQRSDVLVGGFSFSLADNQVKM